MRLPSSSMIRCSGWPYSVAIKGRSTRPLRSSETSSPSSALATEVTDGAGPTTSRCMIRLRRLAGHLVVVFERHDQHGVGVLAEFDGVGHAADDAAVLGLGEGGFVDRAVLAHEQVVGAVQVAAGGVAVLFWPAFVLGLEYAAGEVAQADQGRNLPGIGGAIRPEQHAAVRDRQPLPVLYLADDLVLADEEAALGDVTLRGRRRREGGDGRLFLDRGRCRGSNGIGQAADRLAELVGKLAGGFDAVAGGVEPVLAAPGA